MNVLQCGQRGKFYVMCYFTKSSKKDKEKDGRGIGRSRLRGKGNLRGMGQSWGGGAITEQGLEPQCWGLHESVNSKWKRWPSGGPSFLRGGIPPRARHDVNTGL